jgi:hypothetical protein
MTSCIWCFGAIDQASTRPLCSACQEAIDRHRTGKPDRRKGTRSYEEVWSDTGNPIPAGMPSGEGSGSSLGWRSTDS